MWQRGYSVIDGARTSGPHNGRGGTEQGGLWIQLPCQAKMSNKISQFDIIRHKNPKKYVEGIFLG